ncbi:MAG: glycosyltransferase family 4 protein [Tannerellaceae bacterium]|jgi:glycosyltransferase involved in cell wall biosynthesis|nr:glycosyltransferase family 4 protein [Tannerellaceae bacterium]
MKVVILSTYARKGGAAIAADRLRSALQKEGVEVSMLTGNMLNTSEWKKQVNFLRLVAERVVIFIACHFRRENLFKVSIANTGTDVSRHPLVREADVIHLHWINQGFLSLTDIRKLLQLGKPVIWTMHDMWPFTGICHHARECTHYKETCRCCPFLRSLKREDLAFRVFLQKKKLLNQANVVFVGCSKWITELAGEGTLSKDKRTCTISNPIDTTLFFPVRDKRMAKERMGFSTNKRLLLFGAFNVSDKRKGLDHLIKALRLLPEDEMIEIVIFGQTEGVQALYPHPVHFTGYIGDEAQKVTLYNAVDVFVTPSLEDNLPNTLMEAMACGTPCVGFKVGGIPEMIIHKQTGYLARYEDASDLAEGILWVLNHNEDGKLSSACRQKVETSYAESVVAKQYINLYTSQRS